MRLFNKSDVERKKKEYIKEYQRVCDTITEDDIYHKQIILEYNDGVPDMFIEIQIEGNELVDSIMYDIYSKRLYKVELHFPNGIKETLNIVGELDRYEHDEVFDIDLEWQEPLVGIEYYGIQVSLFDLIHQGVKAYIVDYDLHGIDIEKEKEKKNMPVDRNRMYVPSIKKVIFNNPATIIIWNDGTKTTVKCSERDEYSEEVGLAMCISKKALGSKGNFNEVFKKHIPGYIKKD